MVNVISDGKRKYSMTSLIDENGIRISRHRSFRASDPGVFKILFLGDSFMEGYYDDLTLPEVFLEALREKPLPGPPVEVLNAGVTSYSTVIYIVQARQLIPRLKPDMVVVELDETDMQDDLFYLQSVTFDERGRVLAVGPTRRYVDFLEGLFVARSSPSYLVRLVRKLWHTRVVTPQYLREYNRHLRYQTNIVGFHDPDPQAPAKYATDRALFEWFLRQLADTLRELMGDSRRIVFTYHSHHLRVRPDTGAFRGNPFVAEIAHRVFDDSPVLFYDATEDLREAFRPADDFYWPGDVEYGHFTFKGVRTYGRLLERKLRPRVAALLQEKAPRERQPEGADQHAGQD